MAIAVFISKPSHTLWPHWLNFFG